MTPDEIQPLFTRPDGSYFCARWGRPLSPIIFGVADETLAVFKGALEAVCALAGHQMAETDPELGANLMVFVFRDWDELREVPDLDRLIEGLDPLVDRLKAGGASQYRAFRFDEGGAIRACFLFLCMEGPLAEVPAESLALAQVVQAMLVWSDQAFATRSPLGRLESGATVLRPEIAGVLRAAYDPVMPAVAQDPSHALRLSARLAAAEG